MFGRKNESRAESIVPAMIEIPPKPEIPELDTFEIGLVGGEKIVVEAHYSRVSEGERHFLVITDYRWVTPFSFQPQGTWRHVTKRVLLVRDYTYVKEV